MSRSLFTYGSLEVPEVMRCVTGRAFEGEPATLPGYARRLLNGRSYPGIVAAPNEETRGVLYRSVDPESLAALDRFEDTCYERRDVDVILDSGASQPAQTYVVPARLGSLLSDRPWDRERFVADHLSGFLESCARFRAEWLASRR